MKPIWTFTIIIGFPLLVGSIAIARFGLSMEASDFFQRVSKPVIAVGFWGAVLGSIVIFAVILPRLRRRSREACTRAFTELRKWRRENRITADNYTEYLEKIQTLDDCLIRHLQNFPKEDVREDIQHYLAYAEDALLRPAPELKSE